MVCRKEKINQFPRQATMRRAMDFHVTREGERRRTGHPAVPHSPTGMFLSRSSTALHSIGWMGPKRSAQITLNYGALDRKR